MRDLSRDIGCATWFDLPAVNVSDAMSFYTGLFGWDYLQMENSPLPDYVMIKVRDTVIGGIRRVDALPAPSDHVAVPLIYFTVQKLEDKITRARELGAKLVGERVELGKDRGCTQWIRDREGNVIGLWAPE